MTLDFGLLTVLKQDSAGLQVRSPKTEEWVDVPVLRNGFVVNGPASSLEFTHSLTVSPSLRCP